MTQEPKDKPGFIGADRSKDWGLNPRGQDEVDPVEHRRLADRNRLIVQVMEVNAKQRSVENMHLGVKMELDLARRNEPKGAAAAGLEATLMDLTQKLEKLVLERDFLEVALAEIDGAPLPKTGLSPTPGRA
jgi:hypothetical protein